jgi:hypothetical protein
MQNTTQLFKIFNYSIISKTCLNLLCLVCDQVILCMNGKLLHRKITTLVCCVYAASLPILWENIVQWTFIRSNGTEFCFFSSHTVLMEVLSLMNFIERCFFYTGFTTIWHLLQCTCMCWLFQQEVNYLLINFIACFYDSRLDTKLGIFCAY